MDGPARRLRFGAFLAVAVLAAGFLAESAQARDPVPPTSASGLVAGQASATGYQILGAGGLVGSTALFGRTLVCSPCSVTVAMRDSNLVVASGGAVGLLPGEAVYTFANFVGTIGVTRTFDGVYVLTLTGSAEAIREDSSRSPSPLTP